nr:ATP-binding protein [uncultured Rhodopila sp.]
MLKPEQFELPFDDMFTPDDNPAMWTPREIWVRLNQRLMGHFAEDRRIDYKSAGRVDFEDLSTYLSTFSNTVDGGVIVFGADSEGNALGCSKLHQNALNRIETCHLSMCPQARPEFRKFAVVVNNKPDFCLAVYIPYIGRLIETNKGDAWIRYGDSRHKMSDEEKRDFRSTRQERAFEIDPAPYNYPADFDLRIIQDFCDAFRQRESRSSWSNDEVLEDRHLAVRENGALIPFNNLVLLAGLDPRRSIPGCRVRIQRFLSAEGVGDDYTPIRDKFVEGNIVQIIFEANAVIEDTIFSVTWLNKEGKFVTTPEYPRWAWFESLVNALVHRSYSYSGSEVTIKFFPDRVEIESPGGFVPPVNENTIYSVRATRNYHLMDALRYLGYVQMAREGTRRIRASMMEWGLPDPVFRQEALHGVVVRVTLRNDHETRKRATDRDVAQFFGVEAWKKLQEHEVKIVAFAFRNKSIQVSDAARLSGRTWHTSKKDLDRLVRKGHLVFIKGEYERDSKAHYEIKGRPDETTERDTPERSA